MLVFSSVIPGLKHWRHDAMHVFQAPIEARIPAHLKRERIVHDIAETEKHCTACAQGLARLAKRRANATNIFRHN